MKTNERTIKDSLLEPYHIVVVERGSKCKVFNKDKGFTYPGGSERFIKHSGETIDEAISKAILSILHNKASDKLFSTNEELSLEQLHDLFTNIKSDYKELINKLIYGTTKTI